MQPDYYRDAPNFRREGEGPKYCLEIPHAKLDFTGTYSVVARNVHGEAKAVISLQIYAKGKRNLKLKFVWLIIFTRGTDFFLPSTAVSLCAIIKSKCFWGYLLRDANKNAVVIILSNYPNTLKIIYEINISMYVTQLQFQVNITICQVMFAISAKVIVDIIERYYRPSPILLKSHVSKGNKSIIYKTSSVFAFNFNL